MTNRRGLRFGRPVVARTGQGRRMGVMAGSGVGPMKGISTAGSSGGGGSACGWSASVVLGAETMLSQARRCSGIMSRGGLDGGQGMAWRGVMRWCHELVPGVMRRGTVIGGR